MPNCKSCAYATYRAVVDKALRDAGSSIEDINAIAFTSAWFDRFLLVGSQFAKSLALSMNIPLIAVHHMQARAANLIPSSTNGKEDTKLTFPFYVLLLAVDIHRLYYVHHR